jgi:hypothetical protein
MAADTAEAADHNRRLLGPTTLGLEVTDPRLAAACGLGNIDPQHGPGPAGNAPAAIELCLDMPLPPPGATLVTIRPDPDSIGSMACLSARADGVVPGPDMMARVREIARADRFDRGPWPGPLPLPESLDDMAAVVGGGDIGALAAAVTDSSMDPEHRVAIARRWLQTGEIPERYGDAARQRAAALLAGLRDGRIRITEAGDGRIAVVISDLPGANRLGYLRAPVVVALDPARDFGDGGIGRKYTISQYRTGHADLDAAAEDLNAREPGWGGQPAIKGSPQGHPSRLRPDDVVAIVSRFLTPAPDPSVTDAGAPGN